MIHALLTAGSKLVIASHNPGKVREIAELLHPYALNVVSAGQFDLPEPEETGLTFAENSEIKARATTERTGLPALADDSGLSVAALDGAPGIYSARWAGPNKDFALAMDTIHQELTKRNVPQEKWQAAFICDLCLTLPTGEVHHFEGRVEGMLHFPPAGDQGFGYDPIFVPHGETRTFGQMDAQEKHAISHRAHAFKKLMLSLSETH